VNPTEFDTCAAFATVTMIVPALATSAAGTVTVKASQLVPAQVADVTALGASVALPKRTCVPNPKPVPVIVKVKFALPAATLVGETETICAWTVCGTVSVAAVFPPQPINHNPHNAQPSAALSTIPSFRIGNPLLSFSCSDFYKSVHPHLQPLMYDCREKYACRPTLPIGGRLRRTPGQTQCRRNQLDSVYVS